MFTKSDYKVGAFVLLGVGLIGVVVFLIGSDRGIFKNHLSYRILFDDVAGLRVGAPVQLGGVRIGQVSSVEYREDSAEKVVVEVSVVASDATRIGPESVAAVAAKGMLGDKMVVITKGAGGPLPDGATLPSKASGDLFASLESVGNDLKGAIAKVQVVAEKLGDEGLHDNLRGTIEEVRGLLHEVRNGEGYASRLLKDRAEADRISRLIDTVEEGAKEAGAVMREVRYAVERVRTGPGFVHDLVYGEGPKRPIEQFGAAAEEVALALRGVREADSFAHDVLFGGPRGEDALSNVTRITADVRDMVADIKAGKGTIGALLVDPSIYEDLKRVLGNVERNNVLRALVRYSIKKDAEPPKVDVSER